MRSLSDELSLSGCQIELLRLTDRASASRLSQKDYAVVVSCNMHRDDPLVRERLLQLECSGVQTLLICPKDDQLDDFDVDQLHFYKSLHQDKEVAEFFTQVSLRYLLDFIYVTYQETAKDHYQKK